MHICFSPIQTNSLILTLCRGDRPKSSEGIFSNPIEGELKTLRKDGDDGIPPAKGVKVCLVAERVFGEKRRSLRKTVLSLKGALGEGKYSNDESFGIVSCYT